MRAPLILAVVAALIAAPAAAAQTVVSPSNLQGWQLQTVPGAEPDPTTPPSAVFEAGPAVPPFGVGSLQLSPGSAGDAAAAARNPDFEGVALSELSALTYRTYVDEPAAATEAPLVLLSIDLDGDLATEDGDSDTWVFDPTLQTAPNLPEGVSPQGPVANDLWQSWDAGEGGWYSTSGLGSSDPSNLGSLDTLRAAAPDAILRNEADGLGAVRVRAGFGVANFVGNIDGFRIVTANSNTTFDFEPDGDGDGVADSSDNCAQTPNANQANNDGDAQGDACDSDDDNDGLSDSAEASLGTSPTDSDSDDDGTPDGRDSCPKSAGTSASGCPVSPAGTPEDQPPTVDLTAPAANATVEPAVGTTLRATATDDRGISQVTFLDADGTICIAASAPFECRYEPTGDDVGKNTIIAIATDTAGQVAIDLVRVIVPQFTPEKVSLAVSPKRDRTAPFRFTARGTVTLPEGVTREQGCSGRVAVRLRRGSRTVASGNASVRSNCTYARSFTVPSSQQGALTVTARFGGNAVLKARNAKRTTARAG